MTRERSHTSLAVPSPESLESEPDRLCNLSDLNFCNEEHNDYTPMGQAADCSAILRKQCTFEGRSIKCLESLQMVDEVSESQKVDEAS